MQSLAVIHQRQQRLRFLLLFVAATAALAVCFWRWQVVFDWGYLYPVSWVTATILSHLGVDMQADLSPLPLGFSLLAFRHVTLRIIHECTGIFPLSMLLGAVLAYPARAVHKIRGLLWCAAAFFAYSCLRLVLLGLVAHFRPEWIAFFHVYLMVLLNSGFVLCIWTVWVNGVRRRG